MDDEVTKWQVDCISGAKHSYYSDVFEINQPLGGHIPLMLVFTHRENGTRYKHPWATVERVIEAKATTRDRLDRGAPDPGQFA